MDCADEHSCTVRKVFADVYEATTAVLDQTTLRDALDHAEQADNILAPAAIA
jgi:DNA-binding IscR family transcriptional regulator